MLQRTHLPVLAIDFDDVINHFNRNFLTYMRMVHNIKHVRYEDITEYVFHEIYGVTMEEASRRVLDFCRNYQVDMLKPNEAAVRWLRQIHQEGRYSLHLVTSRCESLRDVTIEWILEHVGDIFDAYHFTNGFATDFAHKRRTKLEVCREINAQAFVDDATAHATQVAAGMKIPVYLPTQPWNNNDEVPGVTRVDSWDEIGPKLLAA